MENSQSTTPTIPQDELYRLRERHKNDFVGSGVLRIEPAGQMNYRMISAKYFMLIVRKYGQPQNQLDWKSFIHQQGGPWPSHIERVYLHMDLQGDMAILHYNEVAPAARAANDSEN